MSQTIERIVFLQGENADEALKIFEESGTDAAFEYLMQWHYPGEHDTSSEYSAGSSDRTYDRDGYRLTVNLDLNYIGLEYYNE